MRTWILCAVLLTGRFCSGADAQDSSQRFADKSRTPLNPLVLATDIRNGVKVFDMTYAGSEGRVPAYLVVPKGSGEFAAIVWAHWLMPGSAFQNRREFLDEAIALAPFVSFQKTSRGQGSMRTWILCAVLLTGRFCSGADAQDSSQRFADKSRTPLNPLVLATDIRNGVKVFDMTYAGSEGRVPAYLVVPKGSGEFAAIVWAHWLMPGSAFQNRREFLDEAIALAPSGVISLLIDAPQNRPGFIAEDDPLGDQQPHLMQEETVDLRRGLDLLLQRKDVDPSRVAFVGHSLGTEAGSALDVVDKRFKAFVFMAGPQSVRELILTSHRPGFDEWRKETPASKIDAYLTTYAWADPATYAAHFGPAAALFQYAAKDDWVTVPEAKQYIALVAGPKTIKFYDSGHALNAKARVDRFAFLQQQLNLSRLPASVAARVPEIR